MKKYISYVSIPIIAGIYFLSVKYLLNYSTSRSFYHAVDMFLMLAIFEWIKFLGNKKAQTNK